MCNGDQVLMLDHVAVCVVNPVAPYDLACSFRRAFCRMALVGHRAVIQGQLEMPLRRQGTGRTSAHHLAMHKKAGLGHTVIQHIRSRSMP
jgi:hypothetical protein